MTTDTVGGTWTYAVELVDALAPLDVEVHLATMGGAITAGQRRRLARSAVAGVHEGRWALEWMPEPWADVERAGEWLLGLQAELGADVVHLNGYTLGALPWRCPVVVAGHSCVCSWWWAVHGTAPPAEWDTYRQRVRAGIHAADAVVAPTETMLAELRRWYGLRGGTVISNGRDAAWVRPVARQPLVLAAGRVWDAAKNIHLLERVAADLGWPSVVAGAGSAPLFDDRREGVRWLGELDFPELASWLLRASIFVAPARYEPFGLAPLEAAQAGCALVLGDIPSLREVWGEAATYVAPDDGPGLRAALTTLIREPALLAEAAARASDRAALFTPQGMAAGYARLYARLPVSAGGRR
jgi:glycosyltransferase involved in cell wall biosynthesis